MKRLRLIPTLPLVCVWLALPGLLWAEDGQPADGYALHQGEVFTLYQASGEEIAAFPHAYSIDMPEDIYGSTKRLFVSFGQNEDESDATQESATLVSNDGGESFEDPQFGIWPWNIVGLRRNGDMIDIDWVPITELPDLTGINSITTGVHFSPDRGISWSHDTATLTLPPGVLISNFRFYGDIYELRGLEPTLFVSYYARVLPDNIWSSQLAASTDGGLTWDRHGVVGQGTDAAYNETSIARTINGELIAVMRCQATDDSALYNLRFSRSIDDGATWSEPQELEVAFDSRHPFDEMWFSISPSPLYGVAPVLVLMPNGILVLSAGRPDNWVAISPDGTGETWELAKVTYQNYPRDGVRIHGSSGYTGIVPLGSNRLFLTGDNYIHRLGDEDNVDWVVDNSYRIWGAFVDVVTPGVGKIDLASKLASGSVVLDTNMSWTSTTHPEARPFGAVDGSTSYWSSAVGADDSEDPYLTIELDRPYALKRIGLSMHYGREASAKVYVSMDGVHWAGPVVDTGARTDYAMTYHDLSPTRVARYVKVVGSYVDDCGGELSGRCAMLNELELYSTVNSFENDPLTTEPRGYTDVTMTKTIVEGLDSRRGVQLLDVETDDSARLRRVTHDTSSKIFEFWVNPVEMPNALLFGLLGDTSSEDSVTAYHLAAFINGTIGHHDPSTNEWTIISEEGLVPEGSWSNIRVAANTTGATVCVDGEYVAFIEPNRGPVISLNGHYISSSGSDPVGSNFIVDDVLFEEVGEISSGTVYPMGTEVCDDRIDNNCNGLVDDDDPACVCQDADLDDHSDIACGGTDCDDSRSDISPEAAEQCLDNVDNDCDGQIDRADADCPEDCDDADDDGFPDAACGGTDCDDTRFDISPEAAEQCADGVDNDCDGDVDEEEECPVLSGGCECSTSESGIPGWSRLLLMVSWI